MNFAKQLKSYRSQNGLKQEEIAIKIGVTRQAYANYEQGTRLPNLEIFRKICEVFNCSADELLELNIIK